MRLVVGAMMGFCFAVAGQLAQAQEKPSAQQRPAAARQPPREPPRPAWAAQIPTEVPEGSIGIVAGEKVLRQSFCQLQVLILNRTNETIRFASVNAEVFFGERSVVTRFNIQLADPNVGRLSTVHLAEGCPRRPTRLVVRQVQLCSRPGPQRQGCGAPFVPFLPAHLHGDPVFQVQVAPDFDK